MIRIKGILLLIAAFLVSCTNQKDSRDAEALIAPILDGMTGLEYPVTTNDTLAQTYFNQGLLLNYGNNPEEAHRSFQQAALLDENLAMAYWGQALVLGPTIDKKMDPDDVSEAYQKALEAENRAADASAKEQALIHALRERYLKEPLPNRSPLDSMYARAMGEVAAQYPNDVEIQTLYAEALMIEHPWNYWKKNGEAQPWTSDIISILEQVLKTDSQHPGANQLYIRVMETSPHPEKALEAAKRLKQLVPNSGFLVHMPAHIFMQTGDYHKATLALQQAVEADSAYVVQAREQGVYPVAYVPHHWHFLWTTASMEGNQALATKAALRTSANVDTSLMGLQGNGTLQHFYVLPLFNYVQFGEWEKILDYPEPNYLLPDHNLLYSSGIWNYAQGMAYVARGNISEAQERLNALRKISNDPRVVDVTIWEANTTREILQIATNVLRGELEATKQNYEISLEYLTQAVEIADQLKYNMPPDWLFPARFNLGAVLLEAGMPAKAENVYRENLKTYPENGWALYGLYQALREQGKNAEASEIKTRFDKAWEHADIQLTRSRIM